MGAVLEISAVSATFLGIFPAVGLNLGCCFRDFSGFSYFLPGLFQLFRWVLGAVLGISAVSATFFGDFPAVGLNLGCCFRSFRDYSYPWPACYAINIWLLYIMLI